MKAVIMAGGKGTRLRPLTCNTPKPMVPIANRPMMSHIVDLVKGHGFDDIAVTLFFLPDAIQQHFQDGRDQGVRIKHIIEDVPLGTAGSVKNAARGFDDTFLVISGDTLTDIDLSDALRFHRESGSIATIVLTRVETPLEYGVVITEKDGRIRRFLEKPGWGEVFSDRVNTGIYLIDPRVLEHIPDGQVFDFSKDLFPRLMAQGAPLFGYTAGGYWSDIGNLDQYRESQFDLLRGKLKVTPAGKELAPGVWAEEDVEVHPSALLTGPAIIGAGSVIGEDAEVGEYSIIGRNVFLGRGASVRRTVLWNRCTVGAGCELRGVVAGDGVTLGAHSSAFEGSVLGDQSQVGERASIRPGVKVWPSKRVEPSVRLSESLIWGNRGSRALFGSAGITGLANIDITPEFATRVAGAFASALPRNSSVVMGSDGYRASRMVKRAVMAGILSAGANVYDLGTLTTSVARYAVIALKAAAGVQVRQDPGDEARLLLEFLDHEGLNLDRNRERAAENAFFGEDFPRADAASVGEVVFVPRLIESYVDGLFQSTDLDAVARRGFRVVVNYDAGHLSMLLPTVLDRLGCEVDTYHYREFGPRPKTLEQILGALDGMAERVRQGGADLGIVVDNNAERLILVDELGRLVHDEHLLALISLVILKYSSAETLAVPVTAPQAVEELAREFNARVVRTKTNPRSQMELLAEQRIFETPGAPRFQPSFDALVSLARVLEMMAREGLKLSELVNSIPPVHMAKHTVPCPWKSKGRVMRSLIEESQGDEVEMIDGLKVFRDNGWALVLPDSDQPVFKVYSEANSEEEADALARLYMNRIEELQTVD